MNISWLGHASFKMEGREATVVTDPFDKKRVGFRLPKVTADIVTISHDHLDHNSVKDVSGNPFVITKPGEYEIKNVFIRGIVTHHDQKEGQERGTNIIFSINMDGLKIAHLGDLGHKLSDEQLDHLGEIDILMIPVGGVYTIDAKAAVEVISQIEPRIVLPMHYKVPGLKVEVEGIKKFCSEMGLKENNYQDKLKITKKDLPQDETQVILLRS
ncbi:MAG: MBL fold metallo-hydrolase [Patescibacteria group bacterium]